MSTEEEIEINPEKGDIVMHLVSKVEYVFYDVRERMIDDIDPATNKPIKRKLAYPVFLLEEDGGRLSEPMVVLGGFDFLGFVERGAPREPGEKPVRNLRRPTNPEKSTITANRPII